VGSIAGRSLVPPPICLWILKERFSRVAARVHKLGQPEVQQLYLAAMGKEDVGGFNVAMDDSFLMGRIKRGHNLTGDIQ